MRTEDQIKALAELDGWPTVPYPEKAVKIQHGEIMIECRDYLESWDAINPLIQSWLKNKTPDKQTLFLDFLTCMVGTSLENWKMDLARLTAAPAQLCEALLRATGKWMEK